jgi:hypothetical protein
MKTDNAVIRQKSTQSELRYALKIVRRTVNGKHEWNGNEHEAAGFRNSEKFRQGLLVAGNVLERLGDQNKIKGVVRKGQVSIVGKKARSRFFDESDVGRNVRGPRKERSEGLRAAAGVKDANRPWSPTEFPSCLLDYTPVHPEMKKGDIPEPWVKAVDTLGRPA